MKELLFSFMLNIKPITGPVGFLDQHRDFVTILASFILLVVAVFIALAVIKIIRNKPKPVIYPDEAALNKITAVYSAYTAKDMERIEFFFQAVDILRDYIEKRFNIKASKMTTEQFLHKLEGIGEISRENKLLIINLLKKKDNIKFAGYDIRDNEVNDSVEFVKRFINITKEER